MKTQRLGSQLVLASWNGCCEAQGPRDAWTHPWELDTLRLPCSQSTLSILFHYFCLDVWFISVIKLRRLIFFSKKNKQVGCYFSNKYQSDSPGARLDKHANRTFSGRKTVSNHLENYKKCESILKSKLWNFVSYFNFFLKQANLH